MFSVTFTFPQRTITFTAASCTFSCSLAAAVWLALLCFKVFCFSYQASKMSNCYRYQKPNVTGSLKSFESNARSQMTSHTILPTRAVRPLLTNVQHANFQRQSLLRSGCSHQVAPFSVPAVFASSIICMVSLRCIIALFYELLMEVSAQSPDIGRCTTQYQIYLSTPGYT